MLIEVQEWRMLDALDHALCGNCAHSRHRHVDDGHCQFDDYGCPYACHEYRPLYGSAWSSTAEGDGVTFDRIKAGNS